MTKLPQPWILYIICFFCACSLYLLLACFRLSTSTCRSSFGGMNSDYWSGFPWKCLGVSFPPGSPWPMTDPVYQSSVYPSYWGLCFGSKFLDNKIFLWHLIWPSGWKFFSRILFFLWQGPWERLWLWNWLTVFVMTRPIPHLIDTLGRRS